MPTADNPEVLVIGADVAGLAATAALAAAGLDVVCVEARDRVGGRLSSTRVEGGALDLGATWFWAGEHRVRRLITRLGTPTFRQHTAGDGLYEDRIGIQRLRGNPIDLPAFRYATGAQALAEALAATLTPGTIRLSSPVTSIESRASRFLKVAVGDRTVRAEQVVLAIPPALALTGIRFDPPLPPSVTLIVRATPVWMGTTSKAVVQYPNTFWREDGLAGAAVSTVGPLREIHDMSGPDGRPAALLGFMPGPAISGVDDQLTPGHVVDHLARLFGQRAAAPSRVLVQDWSRQPYTSPPNTSPPNPGGRNDQGLFGHPVYHRAALAGRLHWASTETSAQSPGHVEGALAAAERAVSHVLTATHRELAGPPPTALAGPPTAKDR